MKTITETYMPIDCAAFLAATDRWLRGYAAKFDSDDSLVRNMVALKVKHTGYVRAICRLLGAHLGLKGRDLFIAELSGLLHDAGRFKQILEYRTFRDADSADHALLSLEAIAENHILNGFSVAEKELIEFAIINHNKKRIAPTDDKKQLFFAKLLRDADKLDIYRVLKPCVAPPDGQAASPELLEHFLAGRQCDYRLMKTPEDRKIMRLIWLYDINFAWTMRHIERAGYIDYLVSFIGLTGPVAAGIARLKNFVREKCAAKEISLGEISHNHA